MKKLLLILSLMIFCAAPSFAICDYASFCPSHAYDLTSRPGQMFSRGTGMTFLSEKVAESMIKKELKRSTKADFNVKVKSYSLKDLVDGRFKSLHISGKNLNIEGVYLTSLDLKTLCDFNYVQLGRSSIKFKENMVLNFSTVISDQDLMKTMKSSGYLDKLNCVNVEGCGITFFKLSGADVKIKNNKLYFKVRVTSQLLLAQPLDLSIATDLKVEDGRIVLTKFNVGNLPKGIDLSKVVYRLNAMNPLSFTLNVLENKNTKMMIKTVNISGDKITVNGNIFIPKNSIQIQDN